MSGAGRRAAASIRGTLGNCAICPAPLVLGQARPGFSFLLPSASGQDGNGEKEDRGQLQDELSREPPFTRDAAPARRANGESYHRRPSMTERRAPSNPHDPASPHPPIRCAVLTISDRASRGEYADRERPRARADPLGLGLAAGNPRDPARRGEPDRRASGGAGGFRFRSRRDGRRDGPLRARPDARGDPPSGRPHRAGDHGGGSRPDRSRVSASLSLAGRRSAAGSLPYRQSPRLGSRSAREHLGSRRSVAPRPRCDSRGSPRGGAHAPDGPRFAARDETEDRG